MAKWVAIRYSTDHVLDYIELDSEHTMFEIQVQMIGWKSIGTLDIRKKHKVNVIGIKEGGK